MTASMLPDDITFDAEGHLSDVALSALADGEDAIVPARAHDHLGRCDRCSLSLADAAARSALVGEALRALAPRASPPVRLPTRLLIAGLSLAAAGALPRLLGPLPDASDALSVATDALPALALRLLLVLRDPGPRLAPAFSAASLLASLVLFAGAVALARAQRRAQPAGPGGAPQETP